MSASDNPAEERYQVIVTTAYAAVQTVRLYEETWHHIAEQHPEFKHRLPSLEYAIIDTISNPTLITVSTTQPQTSVVFTSSTNVKGAGYPLSVPVKLIGNQGSGRVQTAMFATAPKGRVVFVKEGENG